jgi:putative transposase
MARMPRIIVPGQALHIIKRGNNRQATFFSDEDYLKYLDTLGQLSEQYGCSIHAYVLMSNHIHMLATPSHKDSMPLMMQGIGRTYVRYVNGKYRRSGTLWEGRYKSALIDSERYLLICSRYIELNPVRAGMVTGPGQYRWSSYRTNSLGRADRYVTPHALYQRLGLNPVARCQAYRALFNTDISEEALGLIREYTQQCTIVGDNRFQGKIKNMLGRRVMKHGHGGDRKGQLFRRISSVLTP